MDLDRLASLIARLSTLAAALLVVLAAAEWMVNLSGYTLLRGTYTSGRLLEFAAILILFVLTVLLRQVRDALRSQRP
jgi:hypothetical protein